MCLWADFPIERWWICCIRMPSMETWAETPMPFKVRGHPGAKEFEYEDLLHYDRFLQAMGAYNENKIPVMLPSDWGQGNNCTMFMFNNVPSGKADDPQYRNSRQSANVRLVIDFRATVNHNITLLVLSEYENVYEINHLEGIKYNINS